MIDIGQGIPIVLVPGIQGRHEWIRPAVAELGKRARAITYGLAGEPRSGFAVDPQLGFDTYVVQLDAVLENAGVEQAVICGVSYGGLIALRYAALRPHRARALVLVSTPGPRWQPDMQIRQYLKAPLLLSPIFCARAPGRIYPEIAAAHPDLGRRLAWTTGHLYRIARAPMSPRRMAERVRLLDGQDFAGIARSVAVPSLVMHGEKHLDRVVPIEGTREYLDLIPNATSLRLTQTGHIGLITLPQAFADAVLDFAQRLDWERQPAERGRARTA